MLSTKSNERSKAQRSQPCTGIVLRYDDQITFRPWSWLELVTVTDGGTKLYSKWGEWIVEVDGLNLGLLVPLLSDWRLENLEEGRECYGAIISKILETQNLG